MAMNREAKIAKMHCRLRTLKGREKDNAKIINKLERKLRNM